MIVQIQMILSSVNRYTNGSIFSDCMIVDTQIIVSSVNVWS